MSAIESLTNVFVGYVIAVSVQIIVLPMFGARLTFEENLRVGLIFLVVSTLRSYALRRFFEWVRLRFSKGGET